MAKKVLVVKLGSAIISDRAGNIDKKIIQKVAAELAVLSQQYHVVLVSSGAVGSGKKFIPDYRGTLSQRKAAAAIGNPLLIQQYHHYFSKHGLTVAQALCERVHFSNRPQFLQLRETFATFWENNIVPVVNENDLVSNIEIKFSDNDELAMLIAVGFDAAALLLCTSVGGLLDDEKNIIAHVPKVDAAILRYVDSSTSGSGLGGMISKLTFTRLAVSMGIPVAICGLKGDAPLQLALQQRNGTWFEPRVSNLRTRQKWLASGSLTIGTIVVDKGASKALLGRKSLLTVGISAVDGRFITGEVVQLKDEEGNLLGVAKTRLSKDQVESQLNTRNVVAAHADDIVLF